MPKDIPDDATLLDLQNNKITEIKENDFKNLKGLHVSNISNQFSFTFSTYFSHSVYFVLKKKDFVVLIKLGCLGVF